MTFEEQVMNFLNVESNDVEELKNIIFERSAELLQRRKFIEEAGLEVKYEAQTIIAREKARLNNV